MVEVVPAILAKDASDFKRKISLVAPYVRRVQIDVMDGKFVPNKTLQPEEFPPIPRGIEVEYHLMVEDPMEYVQRIGKKKAIYELHVESLRDINEAISEVKKMGGKAALALSPDTPPEVVLPYRKKIEHVLVMTVYPGFSGQSYIEKMEEKMRFLAQGGFKVEVDGGIGVGSARRAARAGATILNVASAIFEKPDVAKAIEEIKKDARG
ncbi:MAG: hypothetical protein N3G22_03540 [Candidatus Micrarchaeota archaeon]|nr:hypothetical protein [Candidatus Micrarchaeota archaeon]